nr:hypothetical protein CFP56_03264 [Quercus suber]
MSEPLQSSSERPSTLTSSVSRYSRQNESSRVRTPLADDQTRAAVAHWSRTYDMMPQSQSSIICRQGSEEWQIATACATRMEMSSVPSRSAVGDRHTPVVDPK